MIRQVNKKKQVKQFIYFIKDLYKDDPYYVFPIFHVQKKELTDLLLTQKSYKALLYIKNEEVLGRLLFTYDYSKKQDKTICYFSYFDCINDQEVANALLSYMEEDMRIQGIDYSEGTFSPFDPDTRRGVMVKGFEQDPSIFTSYNYPYYQNLLENYGYGKAIDTILINALVNETTKKKLNTFSKFFLRKNDVRVDSLSYKHLDRDLEDVAKILEEATNEIIYQDAPDMDLIRETATKMKPLLNPSLVKIARENESNKPVGFCLVVPDFNQVLKKTKGKIRPLRMLYEKRKITKARGQLQYVIPSYQNSGLIGHMFKVIFDEFEDLGITDFEAGTMMENNEKAINAFRKFGGEIQKVYRLYGKEISE